MSKRGTCAKCKRPDMAIVARNLCGKCYAEEKFKGFPPLGDSDEWNFEAQPAVEQSVAAPVVVKKAPQSLLSMLTPPPAVKTEGIFLNFSDRPGLLVDLEAISDDVPGDILELCAMLVQGKLRMVA